MTRGTLKNNSSSVNYQKEITGVVFLAFAVLLGASYYLPQPSVGFLGDLLRSLGKGLFGVSAYVLPVWFMYGAIDFFMEKDPFVARKRVIYVVWFLVAISAMPAILTVPVETISALSLDANNKALASKALKILWQSGMDSSILRLPSVVGGDTEVAKIFTGGVIGGGIALGLEILAAKVGAMILLIAFSLSQCVLIFNLSLSQTASKTAQAIADTTYKAKDAFVGQAKNFKRFSRNIHGLRENQTAEKKDEDFFQIELEQKANFLTIGEEKEGNTFFDSSPMEQQSLDITMGLGESKFSTAGQDILEGDDEIALFFGDEKINSFLKGPENQDFVSSFSETDDLFMETENFKQETQETLHLDFNMTSNAHAPLEQSPLIFDHTQDDPSQVKTILQEEAIKEERIISDTLPEVKPIVYRPAPSSLLREDLGEDTSKTSKGVLIAQSKKLEDTLASFGIEAKVINVTHGPAITRFELTPGAGVKVSRIVNLSDDLALAMAAMGVRIEAPIPGKSAIGIEIPNQEISPVTLRSLIDTKAFKSHASPLVAALGKDIPGNPILCDLAKMPHLLIAGATGSGKSVCINSILISILCRATPEEVKLIMIDPKVVELSIYNGIPHLFAPVVVDPKKAANALHWAVAEMTNRYALFAQTSVRDFQGYNQELRRKNQPILPLILIVIDELADLMQIASKEVEESIARLTAMARAAGIHLLIATQRPSVDVITGVIKANIPSRIAFAVSSQVDSRTILDMVGAEKLLGKGDMLYYPISASKPQRGQGAFVSDSEVEAVIKFWKQQNQQEYDMEAVEAILTAKKDGGKGSSNDEADNRDDPLFDQAVDVVLLAGTASASTLQTRLSVGYPRAARLMEQLYGKGYISPPEGSKARKTLITESEWMEIKSKRGS